jgi:hypothetical protein
MDWIALSAISGAVVAGGTVSVFLFRHLHPRLVALRQFVEHLVGIPANQVTGQERVPGLFEQLKEVREQLNVQDAKLEKRLDQQDEVLAKQDEALATIVHEIFPNSGKSMRDDLNRFAKQLSDHLQQCPAKEAK